jgi:hypothetical protein
MLKSKSLFILDFDGVLFDSAFEVYQVCSALIKQGLVKRSEVELDEFMLFRKKVRDAWEFSYLFNKTGISIPDRPDNEDKEFASLFFKAREKLHCGKEWAFHIKPYPFFHNIKDYLINYPEQFKILSTRNEESIKTILEVNNIMNIEISGQSIVKATGSKIQVAEKRGFLNHSALSIYIDDMTDNVSPFVGKVDFALHAGWGYGDQTLKSVNTDTATKIVNALI